MIGPPADVAGQNRATQRYKPKGRHRPGSNQQRMDATLSTQSCYRRCNSARFTHHTVLPVRAWPALTVHPDFASYNIRKALACRQFRRFTGGVDVFRTCAIPSAGARVSAHATRPVSDSWRMFIRESWLRPCKFGQASLIESGWRHPCLSVRGLAATGRCVSATPSSNAQPAAGPARNWTCRGLWGAGGSRTVS